MTASIQGAADDQVERIHMIQAAARDFLSRGWSNAEFRKLIDTSEGYSGQLWKQACELGWPGLLLPEAEGGADGNFAELVTVVEECGRALAPTPLVAHSVATQLVRDAATGLLRRELLDPSGNAQLTLAVLEKDLVSDRRTIALAAKESPGGWLLDGSKHFVPAAREASAIIVAARMEDGALALFAVPRSAAGVEVERLKPLDWSALDTVRFTGVQVARDRLLARGADAERLLDEALLQGDVLLCAELCGLAETALELAVAYAKERVTYGKPIGQYQAVKHRLVNLRADIEIAKALVRAATSSILAGQEKRHVAGAQAAFWAIDALKKVPEGCLQVFGGIGFTWEHDIHLYLRRCATLASQLGDRAEHREVIANALDASAA